jgi:hypothetical protein
VTYSENNDFHTLNQVALDSVPKIKSYSIHTWACPISYIQNVYNLESPFHPYSQ